MNNEKHVNWPQASASAIRRPVAKINPAVGPALRSSSCPCCNTILRVPANSTFRCSVCLTVTDIGRHSKVSEHASPLSSEEVFSWKQPLQAGQEVDTVSRIRTVFVRPDLLAASFLSRTERPASPNNTISLRALEVFSKLVKGQAERQRALNDAVLTYLKRPYLKSGGLSTWRVFAILLACPFSLAENEILSRLYGLLSNLPNAFQCVLMIPLRILLFMRSTSHQLVGLWRSESFPLHAMVALVDHINSFLSARVRQVGSMTDLTSDWKSVSAAKVLAVIFTANGLRLNGRMPIHAFYNLALDSLGPQAFLQEFLRWEKQNSKPVTPEGQIPFSICQYPFCISLGAKLHILESESRRQMELEAKSAVFSTLFKGTPTLPVIQLRIRRSHLVHDSLSEIAAHIGQLKKSLRIKFEGEDGIDSGGLRKEWLMLLTNQLFHPDFAMFESDEDSKLCWPSGASALLDLKKEFFLVGIVIGLSVYHQATIELPLPLACYKRLINAPVGFADLVALKPALARGLKQLLDYKEDDLEEVFCRTFVGEMEQFGEVIEVDLVPGGKNIPVSKSNRHGAWLVSLEAAGSSLS